jgi:hypothetical protein
MVSRTSDWRDELGRWLKPFLDRLGHKARRQMCPLYVSGLIGPGDRKSVQPMAERVAFGDYDQLHHFIAALRSIAPLHRGRGLGCRLCICDPAVVQQDDAKGNIEVPPTLLARAEEVIE